MIHEYYQRNKQMISQKNKRKRIVNRINAFNGELEAIKASYGEFKITGVDLLATQYLENKINALKTRLELEHDNNPEIIIHDYNPYEKKFKPITEVNINEHIELTKKRINENKRRDYHYLKNDVDNLYADLNLHIERCRYIEWIDCQNM